LEQLTTFQNQALTPQEVRTEVRRWKIAIAGASTHDNLADSSNKNKESYAVFF
jgi:hypothetical protein